MAERKSEWQFAIPCLRTNYTLMAVCFQKQLMFMGCSVLVTAQLKTAKKLVGILYNGKYQVLEDSWR